MTLVDRLTAKGPKRILALDGGGIRGALILGYLEKIEEILRIRHKKPDLLLCEYFDLIGGTSTGAIIAAALAIGKDVGSLQSLGLVDLASPSRLESLRKIIRVLPPRRSTRRWVDGSIVTYITKVMILNTTNCRWWVL